MNWTECEKTIRAILIESAEEAELNRPDRNEDFNVFVALAESAVASFINSNWGLEKD